MKWLTLLAWLFGAVLGVGSDATGQERVAFFDSGQRITAGERVRPEHQPLPSGLKSNNNHTRGGLKTYAERRTREWVVTTVVAYRQPRGFHRNEPKNPARNSAVSARAYRGRATAGPYVRCACVGKLHALSGTGSTVAVA